MIDKYSEGVSGYKDFLKCNSCSIKQVFIESKYNNLRTIKASITKFERVYALWTRLALSNDYLHYLLYSFIADCYETKPVSDDAEEGVEQVIERFVIKDKDGKKYTHYNEKASSLNSLCMWIEKGVFDENAIISEIQEKFTQNQFTDKFKVLHWSIFDLDAETTIKGLKDALKDAYNGFLDADEYVGLIDRLQYYKVYKLPFDDLDYYKLSDGIDKFIERVKTGVEEGKLRFHVASEIMARENEDTKSLLEKLEYIEYNHNYWKLRNNLLEALKDKSDFLYNLNIYGLEELDDELLDVFKKAYQEGDNRRKRELGHFILSLNYTMDMLPTGSTNSFAKFKRISAIGETIKNFEALIDWLKKQSEIEKDIITKMILNQFSIDIQGKLTQLNQDLDNFKQKIQPK